MLAVYCLPIVIRLSGFAQSDLLLVHNFATVLIILATIYYVLVCVPILIEQLRVLHVYSMFEVEALGFGQLAVDIWSRLFVPSQFFVFWLGHCLTQLHALLVHPDLVQNSGVYSDEWYMVFLCAISQICDSPLTLIGTCVAMSYASGFVLYATKMFIQSYSVDRNPHAGLTEGLTMGLLAAQTGLIKIKMPQRLATMSIILFVVVASLVQSIYETTEPMLLALSANKHSNIVRHLKILILCFFLFAFPLYMTYILFYIFDLNFWTLVVISICVMTSVQVIGLFIIYCLFFYDGSREEPWESLDDVIYYTRAVVRCLEFLVAFFVVCAGFHESLVGQWSWSSSAVLIVHCYFNVWQRLQTGWVSFLRRREAAKHIDALPPATKEQLAAHNDVCAICYQTMSVSVRVTRCHHLFHGSCLRKWFYVKEQCPMCSSPIAMASPSTKADSGRNGEPTREQPSAAESGTQTTSQANNERIENISEEAEYMAESRDIVTSPMFTNAENSQLSINENFDNLLHRARRDIRQAKLRDRQTRHSRSKSDSLAQNFE